MPGGQSFWEGKKKCRSCSLHIKCRLEKAYPSSAPFWRSFPLKSTSATTKPKKRVNGEFCASLFSRNGEKKLKKFAGEHRKFSYRKNSAKAKVFSESVRIVPGHWNLSGGEQLPHCPPLTYATAQAQRSWRWNRRSQQQIVDFQKFVFWKIIKSLLDVCWIISTTEFRLYSNPSNTEKSGVICWGPPKVNASKVFLQADRQTCRQCQKLYICAELRVSDSGRPFSHVC